MFFLYQNLYQACLDEAALVLLASWDLCSLMTFSNNLAFSPSNTNETFGNSPNTLSNLGLGGVTVA